MKKPFLSITILFSFLFLKTEIDAQELPSESVLKIEQLIIYLEEDVKKEFMGKITNANLASYFRNKFSERFFYPYRSFGERLSHYNGLYDNQEDHHNRAEDHLTKYADSTQWVLPFNYLNGQAVNAYAIRHLARQHKMVDIAFLYFNQGKDPQYIEYFTRQMRSLNAALESGKYEKIEDGNGVYEVFRSGYRILNWLWIHNMFLGEEAYSDKDQLLTIATLLQHGQNLYERNAEFRSGNHQTRGMAALAMLSILFPDFKGTDQWYERAMLRLSEHLEKEINPDGFQFERSIHYHMSDINNYYYVYQLAKINNIEVDKAWEEKLKSLFTTLAKAAYPDKSAPVLQDDTEIPWGEKNDISGAMTLGYLLFEEPEFGYFASDKVDDRMYWFLSNDQVDLLSKVRKKQPAYGSLAFVETGYYIMREGWDDHDKMMIISAGLDDEKPDHQHGDMLGIQGMANGHVVLPNYQVRYSLEDFDFFKNSMVKNVALVDDELQGKQWTANKGGSGFGKFRSLPNPRVLSWKIDPEFDLFVGSHDGFENVGVLYTRQVIYVKDDFWIVKDNFSSNEKHAYKQVWQGHFTTEHAPDLIRSTFDDASGLDILQLNSVDTVTSSGRRGKTWSVVTKKQQNDYSFVTVLFPYKGYHNRIEENAEEVELNGWVVNASQWKMLGSKAITLSNEERGYFFNIKKATKEDIHLDLDKEEDLFIKEINSGLFIRHLGTEKILLSVTDGEKPTRSKELLPGEEWRVGF